MQAFTEQQAAHKLLSEHELLSVLNTKQQVRFVKADKKLVYSMLAMDKIIQRPQTIDHLMLQTCSELTAVIRKEFINVYDAADNEVLQAMYNNRSMMYDMDCSHSCIVDIAKAVVLLTLDYEQREALLPSTSLHYNPNRWYETLLKFKLQTVDVQVLKKKLQTLKRFVNLIDDDDGDVFKHKLSKFMTRGGAKIRDVYVLFWYVLLSYDTQNPRHIANINMANYLMGKWKSDSEFLLDRFKQKGEGLSVGCIRFLTMCAVDARPNLTFETLCCEAETLASMEYEILKQTDAAQ